MRVAESVIIMGVGHDLEFFDELYRTAHTDTHTTTQVKAITSAGARMQREEKERNETLAI